MLAAARAAARHTDVGSGPDNPHGERGNSADQIATIATAGAINNRASPALGRMLLTLAAANDSPNVMHDRLALGTRVCS
jgi:hypothetical protein